MEYPSEEDSRITALRTPPPTSLFLTAAIEWLASNSDHVFLLPKEYIRNWFQWALNQRVPENEITRTKEALRIVAMKAGVSLEDMNYHNPGPLDASDLSLEGHPLVLKPTVTREDCIAVPEPFYEILRKVHGVICEDFESVSFQPLDVDRLLLHHQIYHSDPHFPPRPIEFRRRLIVEKKLSERATLMEKLMEEGQINLAPEVHPLKLQYSSCTNQSNGSFVGYCLVSRSAVASSSLRALMTAAEPSIASSYLRLWYKTNYRHKSGTKPTFQGDSLDLVDFEALEMRSKDDLRMTMREWVERIDPGATEITLMVESRNVNLPWPRKGLELWERVQVGDFVDAQDVAGQWYEAVVRKVEEHCVTVHYVGWNSKWDAKLKRRRNSPPSKGVNMNLPEPAPLWSRVERWREMLKPGSLVEVRDTGSLAQRPKWYKGIIKKVSRQDDNPREKLGGAELEKYTNKEGLKQELLILDRTQQILIEVEQERTIENGRSGNISEEFASNGDEAHPPFLRWVNLFGEEICAYGTHMKVESEDGPVTLKYVFDANRKPVEVMKSMPHLGSGFMRESLKGSPPAPGSVGLHNLGNSCYLNSTVQCLSQSGLMTRYFVSDAYQKHLNKKNPLGSGGNVAMAYASLMKKMWSADYSILAPRLLKQTVASFAPQFDNCYQHDCQEFCQFLMDGLHEDLNRVQNKPYVEELEGFGMKDEDAAVESWRKHLLRHDSIVVDHCQGMHRSHLTCPRCGRESIKFDVFSSISVPLATNKDGSPVQLEDCLELFMEGEQLDEVNAWYCPNCREHVCALKMIALWSVPDILIIHLKRFTFDTCMSSGGMLRSKIDDTVIFPIEGFDLTKHILGPIDPEAPPVYRLFGVSEHSGPTANSGHYTATVRNSTDGQWYRCNDSHVGLTSGEAAITGGAYLLFYKRTKGSSRWAGMEKVMQSRNVDPHSALEKDLEGFTKVKKKKKRHE